MHEHNMGSRERAAKPWSPASGAEAVLDALTLGLARRQREQRIRAHYAHLDRVRLSHSKYADAPRVTPQLLPDVAPGAKRIAQLALRVVGAAQAIRLETFQGYEATLTRSRDGGRQVSSDFANSSIHEPLLYRIGEATGRDYVKDLRSIGTLAAVLRTRGDYVDIEGVGLMANEYESSTRKTGRVTDAAFLIRRLPSAIAGEFVESLRRQPAETLDGIIYTAFADIEPPGRSLLQAPLANQPTNSLFIPGACNEVMVVRAPTR